MWVYNYSPIRLEENLRKTIGAYNASVKSGVRNLDPSGISWTSSLEASFSRGQELSFEAGSMVPSSYRPFCRQFSYFNAELVHRMAQLPKLFPTPAHGNVAIGASGERRRDWSCLIVDTLPDLESVSKAQWFSLYTYEPVSTEPQGDLLAEADLAVVDGYRRKDNITDATLTTYRGFYEDTQISKEDIFYYVYGLLHSPTYKEQYKADLMKMLPRIPKVKDFWGFSQAGRDLAELHLNYEAVEPYPLEEVSNGSPKGEEYDFYRINKMSFGTRKDRSRIVYNHRITLAGIPDEAYDYQVNGKSALEWILDRYQVTTHKDSQITNDPNDYCREIGDPRYIVDLIKRIVTVSMETTKIVAALPHLDIVE
jgi:predicted helicase